MTIDEAIDELQNQCCVPNSVFKTPPYQARALSIEILRAWKKGREKHGWFYYPLLPGETE